MIDTISYNLSLIVFMFYLIKLALNAFYTNRLDVLRLIKVKSPHSCEIIAKEDYVILVYT